MISKRLMSFLAAASLVFSSSVFAQEKLTEFTEEGRSESTDLVQAKQEAIDDAVEKVSSRLARDLIGDAKFDRNITSIKAKVFAQSEKYVPFIKASAPKMDGQQTRIMVTLKVSQKSLEALLQQAGFLGSTEGVASVLSSVAFVDLINRKSFRWWIDTQNEENGSFLKSQEKVWTDALALEFPKSNLSLLLPNSNGVRRSLPQNLQSESLRVQDYQTVGEFYKAQMVIKGDIKVDQGRLVQTFKIISRLSVLQTSNGRVIADVVRTDETEPGPIAVVVPKKMAQVFSDLSQDLSAQVSEAWSKGAVGTNTIRLVIHGNFDFRGVESLKDDIRSQARSVRNITERLFTKSEVEFDVETDANAESLAKNLGQVRWKNYALRVESFDANRVQLKP